MPTNLNNEQQLNEETPNQVQVTERVLGTSDIPEDFSIEEAVITILDRGGEEPVLNEYALELTEQVHNFLYKHVENCFKSDRLKFGKFNPQVNGVKDISNKLLRNEENIIDSSKTLSNILFEIMQNDEGIESCDLVTMSIATNRGSMVAIMKLDYAKNFMHHIDFLEEKISIGITTVKTGLPSRSIQKAAFIKANNNDGFDLYYMDELRKSKDSADYNMHYWSNDFLNCVEVINAKSTTMDFVKASEQWIRATRLENAKKSEEIRTAIREKMLEEDNLSIEDLANEIFNEDVENANSFKEFMSSLNFEDNIKVDKPTAIKKLNKIKIKIDKDITLTIDRDSYNDGSKFQITENDDGSINMTLKNIMSYVEK